MEENLTSDREGNIVALSPSGKVRSLMFRLLPWRISNFLYHLRHPRTWLRWKSISHWWDGYDEGVEHGWTQGYKKGKEDAIGSLFGPAHLNGFDVDEYKVDPVPNGVEESDDELPLTISELIRDYEHKDVGGM